MNVNTEHISEVVMNDDTVRTQHRLMILGSMDEFVDLVDMARDRGIYVIVCDGYADGPAKSHADASFNINVRDTDAIAKVCKDEHVDGIIASFSDLLAECLVDIADKAGLDCYAKPDRFNFLREKALMKEMFAELGVNTAKSVRIHRESIADDAAKVGYPCVVKPADGYGSHGIYVLDSAEAIAERFDEIVSFSTKDYLLAEQRYTGHEFNMMNWILDGEVVTLSIADRETSSDDPTVIPYVTRIVYPSRLIDAVEEEAREIVRKVAAYVGITNGPLSMQFFYSEEDGIQVCECAGRLFGYEHELLTYASGLAVEDLLLDRVYDIDALRARLANHTPHHPHQSCGIYLHGHEGTVADISAALEAGKQPHIVDVLPYYKPGDFISRATGAKPYVMRYYLRADDRAVLDEESARIFSQARVLDAEGNDLLFPAQMSSY